MARYAPPYRITSAMLGMMELIGETLGRLKVGGGASSPRLRRGNRIRSIQSSCAIEGNSLNIGQVTAFLEGKRVLGTSREIQEVRNAFAAYERLPEWEAHSCNCLLTAHEILMAGLVDDAGRFRSGGVGIRRDKTILHVAPPANRVSPLMADLLAWLKTTDEHPLIASCIFHYEFEFIHPFSDGNGRLGRLWQTLILSRWNPVFSAASVETMIASRQAEYYAALNDSNQAGECGPFILFMLGAIRDSLLELPVTDQETDQVTDQVMRLLFAMRHDARAASSLMAELKLAHRPTFRDNYLHPALASGLIEMTHPDTPRARNQKYRLTEKGYILLANNNHQAG